MVVSVQLLTSNSLVTESAVTNFQACFSEMYFQHKHAGLEYGEVILLKQINCRKAIHFQARALPIRPSLP